MLGLDFIKAESAAVEKAIEVKGVEVELDDLLSLDCEVRGAKTEIEALRAERNAISARFKDVAPEERAALGQQAKEAGARRASWKTTLPRSRACSKPADVVPNIPWDGAPVGPDESFNTRRSQEGEVPKFDFEPLDHVALIEKNDWADLSRIVQVSGSRQYCLKGRLALLETKLMGWALERIADAVSRRSPFRRSPASRPSSTRASFPATSMRHTTFRRRRLSGGHGRGCADLAPFGRDHRGR